MVQQPFSFPPPPPPPPSRDSPHSFRPIQQGSNGSGRPPYHRPINGGQPRHYNKTYPGQNHHRSSNCNEYQPDSSNRSNSLNHYNKRPGYYQQRPQNAANAPHGRHNDHKRQYGQSPNNFTPHKRKRVTDLDQSRKESHHSPTKHGPNDNRGQQKAKVKVAPAVPSFGFALPTLDATALSKGRPMTRAHKHDKIRDGLGLRADSEEAEDSGEEDVDEEAAFAGSTTELRIEYNGEVYHLSSPAEIRAWIKERKKCFPTKQRIEEKRQDRVLKQAMARQLREMVWQARGQYAPREHGKDRSGIMQSGKNNSAHSKESPQRNFTRNQKANPRRSPSIENENGEHLQLDASSEPLANSLTAEDVSHSGQGLSLNYDSDDSEALSGAIDHDSDASSTISSSSSNVDISDLSSSDDDDDDDDDGAPVEQSSKLGDAVEVPQSRPSRRPELARKTNESGRIGNSSKKKGPNERAKPGAPKKPRLLDKLLERERDDEDRVALQAIKQLGSLGFFADLSSTGRPRD